MAFSECMNFSPQYEIICLKFSFVLNSCFTFLVLFGLLRFSKYVITKQMEKGQFLHFFGLEKNAGNIPSYFPRNSTLGASLCRFILIFIFLFLMVLAARLSYHINKLHCKSHTRGAVHKEPKILKWFKNPIHVNPNSPQ